MGDADTHMKRADKHQQEVERRSKMPVARAGAARSARFIVNVLKAKSP